MNKEQAIEIIKKIGTQIDKGYADGKMLPKILDPIHIIKGTQYITVDELIQDAVKHNHIEVKQQLDKLIAFWQKALFYAYPQLQKDLAEYTFKIYSKSGGTATKPVLVFPDVNNLNDMLKQSRKQQEEDWEDEQFEEE